MSESSAAEVLEIHARPFVKWAGGKNVLLGELRKRLPSTFGRYFEPFLGGGAFFFDLAPRAAVLNDLSPELVNCYQVVRDQVDQLIDELARHRYEREYFYSVRAWDREPGFDRRPAVERAARFIFLNKTCFNGLYRVNSQGHFNVPFGDYTNPSIVDVENLHACSAALNRSTITCGSYLSIEDKAQAGDFVYFDPPYVPLNTTSSFTHYAKAGFSLDDHGALRNLCSRLHKKGVKFMLSNSWSLVSLGLYDDFDVETVEAPRAINSKAGSRGRVREIIVRNY